MPKSLIIDVTQEDIDEGKRFEPCGCPVALAVQKKIPERRVIVYSHKIQIGEDEIFVELPPSAKEFICKFDKKSNDKSPVSPFSFELVIPD